MLYPLMNYHFSDRLDLVKLQEFYDGDPRIAVGVFEAFVQETVTALPQLDQLFQENNVVEFRRLVHKIKPGFLYVGLTSLYGMLSELEQSCDKSADTLNVAGLFSEVDAKLKSEIPWVEEELDRMRVLEAM